MDKRWKCSGTEEEYKLEQALVEHSGEYKAEIWTKNNPNSDSILNEYLGTHTVNVQVGIETEPEVLNETKNEFKLGYWQSYGLVLEGQLTNETWDLSNKAIIQDKLY